MTYPHLDDFASMLEALFVATIATTNALDGT